jgi:hypothetical protein
MRLVRREWSAAASGPISARSRIWHECSSNMLTGLPIPYVAFARLVRERLEWQCGGEWMEGRVCVRESRVWFVWFVLFVLLLCCVVLLFFVCVCGV